VPLSQAIQQIHFPDSWERLREAQHRLAFDEMFMLQLGVMRQKREWETLQTEPLPVEDAWITSFKEKLPFALTGAQEKALRDIRADMASPRPMNRLLQGDVGSGKTVVAAAAAGMAIANGAQSAFMAPTSILAEQHLQTLRGLLPSILEIPVESIQLLIGATPEAEKARIREGLDSGDIKVVVGTHALIEDPVSFHRLGLAVIDEQHRFGVHQRAALRAKGANPNLLVMTATPIPRSLALTVYGDLDLTLLDEMPPGRKPVETRALHPRERLRAYSFITSQLEQGRQAFIIFPLVEESDKFDARAAVDEHRELQETIFARFRVGLLHGRMKPEEKEQVMRQFRAGEIDVLVSTSVVEVGVDVPNATVMLVEGANRFGLAQLHQFRGRVGRGQAQSYCLLIPDTEDATDNARLQAMQSTNDGFQLAEMDLSQRGPGDFLRCGFLTSWLWLCTINLPRMCSSRPRSGAGWSSRPSRMRSISRPPSSAGLSWSTAGKLARRRLCAGCGYFRILSTNSAWPWPTTAWHPKSTSLLSSLPKNTVFSPAARSRRSLPSEVT